MSKPWIIVILLIVAGIVGYSLYKGGTDEDEATPAVSEAVQAPAADDAAAVSDAVETVTEAVTDAVEDAIEAATGAVVEKIENVVEEATEAASKAVSDATAGVADFLTPGGFDQTKVVALINESSLPAARKIILKSAVDQAKSNPALLQAALAQVKTALGL